MFGKIFDTMTATVEKTPSPNEWLLEVRIQEWGLGFCASNPLGHPCRHDVWCVSTLVLWRPGKLLFIYMYARSLKQDIQFQKNNNNSLRSKRFQSSYWTKVRAEAKKKVEGGGGKEKRKRLPANPTILENAPLYFTVWFICKLTARQNRNITNRLRLYYQICKITLISNRTRCRRLQEL